MNGSPAMAKASISVVIASYNRATLVGRAIESALAAITAGDEIIVVDDGSTDNTQEVLAQYGNRIRSWRIPNGGAGAARNYGIWQACGELVAFLDDDDEWMPHKLQLQRAVMLARPDALFCFSNFCVRDQRGRVCRNAVTRLYEGPRPWQEVLGPGFPFSSLVPLPPGRPDFQVHVASLYATMLQTPCVLTSTVVVRRREAGAALQFAEDLPLYEDYLCFARLAQAGSGAYLDCETAFQNTHYGPRLINADDYTFATARIAIVERIWGSDPAFLAAHDGPVRNVLADLHRVRAGWLMRQGRGREAREEYWLAGEVPLSRRVLACLPGPVVRSLLGLYDGSRSVAERLVAARTDRGGQP
jgi:glycosyltransferase involved in cell wall biosynthesis